jgi:hypothetical protein
MADEDSKLVLSVPEIDLYHVLRPWRGFEAAYQGFSSALPIYLCENNKPVDAQAEQGVDGIDPNLISGLPMRMGTATIIWFPPILTIEATPRGYNWVIEWRMRNCRDFRNTPKARMPFHGPKQGQGCPETVVNPGARIIIPAATETQVYVQTEPAGTQQGSVANLRMVAVTSNGYQLSQPFLPGGARGVVQQGIAPAAIAGRNMAQFLIYETQTAGDELLVSLWRDAGANPLWDFASGQPDYRVSQVLGLGTGAQLPDLGVMVMYGVSP